MIYACAKEIDFDALGGKILPEYPTDTPFWIKSNADLICGPIVYHDYGESTKKYVKTMKPIFGANMAFKQEVFEKYGYFRTDLGAGQGTMGEDTEFYNRLSKHTDRIYYCGKVKVWHPAIKNRMTLGYIARWNIGYGKYCVVKDNGVFDKDIVCYGRVPRYLFKSIFVHIIKLMFACFNKRNFLVQWVFLFREIGMFQAYRGYRLSQMGRV